MAVTLELTRDWLGNCKGTSCSGSHCTAASDTWLCAGTTQTEGLGGWVGEASFPGGLPKKKESAAKQETDRRADTRTLCSVKLLLEDCQGPTGK